MFINLISGLLILISVFMIAKHGWSGRNFTTGPSKIYGSKIDN